METSFGDPATVADDMESVVNTFHGKCDQTISRIKKLKEQAQSTPQQLNCDPAELKERYLKCISELGKYSYHITNMELAFKGKHGGSSNTELPTIHDMSANCLKPTVTSSETEKIHKVHYLIDFLSVPEPSAAYSNYCPAKPKKKQRVSEAEQNLNILSSDSGSSESIPDKNEFADNTEDLSNDFHCEPEIKTEKDVQRNISDVLKENNISESAKVDEHAKPPAARPITTPRLQQPAYALPNYSLQQRALRRPITTPRLQQPAYPLPNYSLQQRALRRPITTPRLKQPAYPLPNYSLQQRALRRPITTPRLQQPALRWPVTTPCVQQPATHPTRPRHDPPELAPLTESKLQMLKIDPEHQDPLEAITGSSTNDDTPICKFNKGGPEKSCFRGALCKKKHILHNKEEGALDKMSVVVDCTALPLPARGTRLRVHVTCVEHFDHVFVQLAPSDKDVAAERLQRRFGVIWPPNSLEALVREMNSPAQRREYQPLKIAPRVGTLVAAINPFDKQYYRARPLLGTPADHCVEVFYVDYGNTVTVREDQIAALPERYAKLPEQAVRCRLAGVEAKTSDSKQWAVATEALSKLVLEETLDAYVVWRDYDKITVNLYDKNGENIAEKLAGKHMVNLSPFE